MKHFQSIRTVALLCLAVAWVALAGCSTVQPYTYANEREQLPGPGLLTGETGEWQIYCYPDKQATPLPAS